MALFFFHVSGDTQITDLVGAEEPDRDAARSRAVLKMSELLSRNPEAVYDGREIMIQVVDQSGQEIFRVVTHAV